MNDPNEHPDSSCRHTVRIDSLCALCGAEISMDESLVPALHLSDRIFQTSEEALKIQKRKNRKLAKHRKMILILDIDQTILHSSLNPVECDFTFMLFNSIFYVILRPNLQYFLEKISKLFEIHIYTMGTRDYATMICDHIDPDGRFFGERIVSRSENFNLHKKSIDRISCISNNVLILDDRADVWDYNKNLILIKPFWVRDKIDINDPNETPLYIRQDVNSVTDTKLLDDDSELLIDHPIKPCPETDQPSIKVKTNLIPSTNGLKHSPDDNQLINKIENRFLDDELKAVYKILKKLHMRYFQSMRPVQSLLRLKFMKNIRIAASSQYFPLILFSGATIDLENPNFVLEDDELAQKYKVKNVKAAWLYECIYKRRMVLIKDYLIWDYSEIDEYEEELLKDL